MKTTLKTGAAVLALLAGGAQAQDLSGETVTVFGTWLGTEQEAVEKVFDL